MNKHKFFILAFCFLSLFFYSHLLNAQPMNLMLALDGGTPALNDSTAVFKISESGQSGTDLNADGDTDDRVVHILNLSDISDLTLTNLGIAANFTNISETNLLAINVDEFDENNTDLNGDGDTGDNVINILDIDDTLVPTNLMLDSTSARIENGVVVFEVDEGRQNNTDLNGDGDTDDLVVHILDLNDSMIPNNTMFARDGFSGGARLDNRIVAFNVRESGGIFMDSAQGNADLNGDGDTDDSVLHIIDLDDSLVPINIMLDSALARLDSNVIVFLVDEDSQNSTDLNGDGDTNDRSVHILDLNNSMIPTDLGLAGGNLTSVNQNVVVFTVDEQNQNNTDLNGDGDANDTVLHIVDLNNSMTPINTMLAVDDDLISQGDNLIFFAIRELDQNNTDLNGDGDTGDNVVHYIDLDQSTEAINLMLATNSDVSLINDRVIVFRVDEQDQNNTDLNNDGDTNDSSVLHILDLNSSTDPTNMMVNAFRFNLNDDFLVFTVDEISQGNTDLNGDGDATDNFVLHILEFINESEESGGGSGCALTPSSSSSFPMTFILIYFLTLFVVVRRKIAAN